MSKKNFSGGLNSLLGEQPKTLNPAKKNTISKKAKLISMLEEDKAKLSSLVQDKKLINENRERLKKGRPKTVFKEITKSSQEGTKENETRATFIINEDLLDKLKAIAYWDRILIKEVVNISLLETVAKYEKKHGSIKPIPKK